MSKILVISKYYHPFFGGTEENIKSISEKAAQSHAVVVIANSHEGDSSRENIGGVSVLRRRVIAVLRGQPICRGLLSGIRLADFDAIHFHAPNPYASLILWLRMFLSRRAPALVVTHHMDMVGRPFLRRIALPFARHTLRSARAVIVTSAKNARISRDLPRGCPVEVVPLGVDSSAFEIDAPFREEARAWRAALCGEAPVVGFCGRLVHYKGLEILLRALAQLPGVRALIAGDGPLRCMAEALADELGVADRAVFLGRIDERTRHKLLASVDCFAFPSTDVTEAFGLAQMEAMLCGAPVVASDLPTGVTDVAIHMKTALLVRPNDPAALAAGVARILHEPALAHALAQAAREHVRAHMDADTVAARTVDILEAAVRATRIRRLRARAPLLHSWKGLQGWMGRPAYFAGAAK